MHLKYEVAEVDAFLTCGWDESSEATAHEMRKSKKQIISQGLYALYTLSPVISVC